MKTTELQKLIDFDACLSMPRYSRGHDEQMKGLFKGSKVLAHWKEGGYQGTVATAVQLEDGRYCWYQDSYGSCSGCDSWDGASDENAKKLLIGMAIDAEVFDTYEELLKKLQQTDSLAYWKDIAAIELHKLLVSHQASS